MLSSTNIIHVFSYLQKRSSLHVRTGGEYSTVASPKCAASDPTQLKSARQDIKELLKNTFCHPILVFIFLFLFFFPDFNFILYV